MKSLVSIIIPIYNVSDYLEKCLTSVQKQTYTNWEAILINDGSTDDSAEIAQRFVDRDKRFRLISQKNLGPAVARNSGLQKANAPYIVFIDADDSVQVDYLQILLYPLTKNEGIELVCAGYYELSRYNSKAIPLHDFQSYEPQKIISGQQVIDNIFNGITGVLWSKLFKRDIILEYEIFLPEEIKFSEDLIFVLRYAKHIQKVGLIYKPIYLYNRLNDTGLSRKLDESYFTSIERFNKLVLNEIKGSGHVEDILQRKTGKLLVEIMKIQATSTKNLKRIYGLIINRFNGEIFCYPKPRIDTIFIWLLRNKRYNFAFFVERTIRLLRKLKHA